MTRTRTKRKPPRRLSGARGGLSTRVGSDPTTIANPHARPKAGSLRPMAQDLPEVVDHRGSPCPVCGVEHRVRFATGRGEEHGIDNVLVWQIWYRTEYDDGHCDGICVSQTIVSPRSAGESGAIEILRRLQRGYRRLHVFEVTWPPTTEDLAAIRQAEHRRQLIERATGRG